MIVKKDSGTDDPITDVEEAMRKEIFESTERQLSRLIAAMRSCSSDKRVRLLQMIEDAASNGKGRLARLSTGLDSAAAMREHDGEYFPSHVGPIRVGARRTVSSESFGAQAIDQLAAIGDRLLRPVIAAKQIESLAKAAAATNGAGMEELTTQLQQQIEEVAKPPGEPASDTDQGDVVMLPVDTADAATQA